MKKKISHPEKLNAYKFKLCPARHKINLEFFFFYHWWHSKVNNFSYKGFQWEHQVSYEISLKMASFDSNFYHTKKRLVISETYSLNYLKRINFRVYLIFANQAKLREIRKNLHTQKISTLKVPKVSLYFFTKTKPFLYLQNSCDTWLSRIPITKNFFLPTPQKT